MTKSQAIMGGIESAIMTQLAAGRNGIQTIFTFLDTQLPLPYVHIICLLVKVYRACAVECAPAPLNWYALPGIRLSGGWSALQTSRLVGVCNCCVDRYQAQCFIGRFVHHHCVRGPMFEDPFFLIVSTVPLCVQIMLFMSAVEFGLRFGLSIIRFVGPDTIQFWNPDHPWWIWLLSVIQLGGYSVLYQGLLNVQELISSMRFWSWNKVSRCRQSHGRFCFTQLLASV
jgi:hypothetical protein